MADTEPWHHRWQHLDETDDPRWYIRFLDVSRRGTLAQIQAAPGVYYAFLEPSPGLRILDVGSGTGSLLGPLVPLIQPGGTIVGVDISAVMVSEANHRAAQLQVPIEFKVGTAEQLPFADGSFDRAMANQLLVHLDDPAMAVREMTRVTRSGGFVAIWEADWETMAVDAPDRGLTRRIMNAFCDSMPQGWIGRTLPRLFADARLVDVRVESETLILPGAVWLDPHYGFGRICDFAQRAGAITAAEQHAWEASVEERSRQPGGLFVAFTGFRVVGQRP